MAIRPIRLTITLSALSAAGYLFWAHSTPKPQKPINPPGIHQTYLGAFANHVTDGRHLACLEKAVGQKMDLSVRYLDASKELFPYLEASLMNDSGRALFIKLKITPQQISHLSSKAFLKKLKDFNKGIEAFGGRLFIGFELKASGSSPDWTKILTVYRQTLSAQNITWVWPAALASSADAGAKWVAVEIFQKINGGHYPSFNDLAREKFETASLLNRSIILTVGSNAPKDARARFMEEALAFIQTRADIAALVFHDVSSVEEGAFGAWQMSAATLEKVQQALLRQGDRFVSDVSGKKESPASNTPPSWDEVVQDFSLKAAIDRGLSNALSTSASSSVLPKALASEDCAEIRSVNYDAFQLKRAVELWEDIQALEESIPQYEKHSIGPSLKIKLAHNYAELASFSKDRDEKIGFLMKAAGIVNAPIDKANAQKIEGSRPDRFPIVPGYFDICIDLASKFGAIGNLLDEKQLYQNLLTELEDKSVLVEEQIGSYAVKGYKARLHVKLGEVHEKTREYRQATEHYQQAADWAVEEQDGFRIYLFWKGETRAKLRYVAAQALLGIARINLDQINPAQILEKMDSIFSWKEIGQEDGFLDLGHQALILAMQACIYEATSPTGTVDFAKAKQLFFERLPWDELDKYADLKHSMGFSRKASFLKKGEGVWEMVLEGLDNLDTKLDPSYQARLDMLKVLSPEGGK